MEVLGALVQVGVLGGRNSFLPLGCASCGCWALTSVQLGPDTIVGDGL